MDVLDRHGRLVIRPTHVMSLEEIAVSRDMAVALKERADDWRPKTIYDRAALPLRWARVPRLGMDVKDVMLVRSMEPSTVVLDSDGYTLRYGEMDDPYTGERLIFEQATDSTGFHIELDHVVSLADVFVSGGHRWLSTSDNWLKVANFPANLLAVSKRVNQEKGSRNAALWLPNNPRRDFRQRFVMLQIQVKSTFRLSVTQSEKAAMLAVLDEPPAILSAG